MFCLFVTVHAQEFKIPNYSLEKAEDYDTYEKDVVAATKWLVETPINSQKEMGKIKAIERYEKLQKKGKLEKHLKSKL